MGRSRASRSALVAIVATMLLLAAGCSPFWQSSGPKLGSIQFGFGIRRVSAHQIDVSKVRTTFHVGQPIAWVAYLKHSAGATSLTLTIIPASGTHPAVLTETIPNVNPNWIQIANPGEPELGLEKLGVPVPGSYIFRYSRGNIVLAQGTIRLKG